MSLEGGDLGLGKGLKPGGIPVDIPKEEEQKTRNIRLKTYKTLYGGRVEDNSISKGDDLLIGTSLKQQKKLFERQVAQLSLPGLSRDHHQYGLIDQTKDGRGNQSEEDSIAIQDKNVQRKLYEAQWEIERLTQDLEICKNQLDAKYKSIKLLQNQEVNRLQFELELRQSTLIGSQETWRERFDRVCKENSALFGILAQERREVEELRQKNRELERQTDDLKQVLNDREKKRFEFLERALSTEESDDEKPFTAEELAVLGTCNCRLDKKEPCRCAKTCVTLHRRLDSCRSQIFSIKQQRMEALLSVDAYRQAFEEQLNRNEKLLRDCSKTIQLPPLARENVLQFLRCIKHIDNTTKNNDDNPLDNVSDTDIFTILIEMISERNEALANQRLAVKILGTKVQEYEKLLKGKEQTNVINMKSLV
ncbi:DgyrCDS7589 [Dimorphilus gyrociliatus]|uniref:DgyrCDS7589 n=1 Tax=Dimorphilus gyrociliatus TaxID=2664684 RepID=A0A7I8VTP8_9ANNE|nr:DgyrCDS7589 [Dimorphilus gyrociliatus]